MTEEGFGMRGIKLEVIAKNSSVRIDHFVLITQES
jgi:hypothetical protein